MQYHQRLRIVPGKDLLDRRHQVSCSYDELRSKAIPFSEEDNTAGSQCKSLRAVRGLPIPA